MSNIKISELPTLSTISANTSETLLVGVDSTTNTTSKITVTVLAQGLINYSNTAIGIIQGVNASQNVRLDYSNSRMTIIEGTDSTQNARITVIEGTDITQNTRITVIENTDLSQNARMAIIEDTDASQNARMAIIEDTDASQNVRLDYSNTAINIIQGTNTSQNTRLTVIEGTDVSQNLRLDFSNSRITLVEYVDFSQNVRLDYSNTAIGIIQGVDNSQNVRLDFSNTRMTIIDGVNTSQNVRLDFSNTRMSISDGVNTSQNVRLDWSNTSISATDGKMQVAFDKANSTATVANTALANTIGTFYTYAGNLTVTGNLIAQKAISANTMDYPLNMAPQTAITIDYANNSLIRCNTSTGLTVSHTNFVFGRTVELWVTNQAPTTQVFTHGVGISKSTANAATYTIPATSSILAKFYCFGNAANTYVSIIHI